MTARFNGRERWAAAAVGVSLAVLPVAAPLPLSSALTSAAVAQTNKPVLRIGAIPDQKPEKLNRLYGLVANELSKQLGVDVKYVPVTNYAAAVSAFRTGNLDCLLYTSPSPRDRQKSRMPSSA